MAKTIPNVYFIGPMGAGKTTVGRYLADLMGRRFLDSDHEIEARTGASIPWIFEKEGEAGFRIREHDMLKTLSRHKKVVMATGGGAILRPENRQILRNTGLVVYLETPVSLQLHRLARDRSRPLLQQGNVEQVLTGLYQVRHPLYLETAHIVVPAADDPARELAARIFSLVHDYVPGQVMQVPE